MRHFCHLKSCGKLGSSLEQFEENAKKYFKNGHIIQNNTGYFFSKKECSSNDAPYCPLQACKNWEDP